MMMLMMTTFIYHSTTPTKESHLTLDDIQTTMNIVSHTWGRHSIYVYLPSTVEVHSISLDLCL